MLIKINDLQIINWTNQHLEITSGYTLNLVNLDGSKIELVTFTSFEEALETMNNLARDKAMDEKTEYIEFKRGNG